MQESPTALSLLGSTIEQVRAQRIALADLRQQLEDRSRTDGTNDTFTVLARCLAYEAFAHELALWDICRAWMAPSHASLAPQVQNLHDEQENYLGLLEFAVRTTTDFLGSEAATVSGRALLASLGMWVGGQRRLLRSERDRLVPALLAP
jgi:hypothetical protein